MMGGPNHAGAILILGMNVELYPDSANAWSSLGDAHQKGGDIEKATKAYKKAIELDPQGAAGMHAEEMLLTLEKQ